jgi:type IV pilus assembly protein PilV
MQPTKPHCATPQRRQIPQAFNLQSGISLIEVLVSIFVFSLGLVGMLSMSVAALENNKTAQLRMTGVSIVNDYAERVRMNIRAFDAVPSPYAVALGDVAAATAVVTNPDATNNAATNPITAANVAQADVQALLSEAANRLPQGDAVVAVQGTPGTSQRNLHMWLLWVEPTPEAGSVAAALFAQGQQKCPSNLTATEKAKYSCMYFMVPL